MVAARESFWQGATQPRSGLTLFEVEASASSSRTSAPVSTVEACSVGDTMQSRIAAQACAAQGQRG